MAVERLGITPIDDLGLAAEVNERAVAHLQDGKLVEALASIAVVLDILIMHAANDSANLKSS